MHPIRSLLLWASRNERLRERLPRHAFTRRAVRRFMPGERAEDALDAAARLQDDGIGTVLTYLGENVDDPTDAAAVADHYGAVLDDVARRGLDCEVSVKLTQLGLDRDAGLAREHLSDIARRAAANDRAVWIDMESSAYTDITLDLYRAAHAEHDRLGLCLQSYLYRTMEDLDRLRPHSPAIRLVKGAYAERREIAFPRKRAVDDNYARLAVRLLDDYARDPALRIAFATHDEALLRRIAAAAREAGVSKDAFEIQMLYGIRPKLQHALAREGFSVRVLISYGAAWYPWFVRRLAERPANLLFVARHMISK